MELEKPQQTVSMWLRIKPSHPALDVIFYIAEGKVEFCEVITVKRTTQSQ